MDQRLSIFWHPSVLNHDTGSGILEAAAVPDFGISEPHPESAERIANIKTLLENGPLCESIDWRDGRLASRDELVRFHDPAYLDRLEALDMTGGRVTATTVFGKGSWTPVRAAAGTALEAMDHVLAGIGPAYALIRPPGHHAARDRADGYCFVNNIGVAVEHAAGTGVERIAIVDWDVHHGNGTQTGFYDRADVLSVSIHMNHGSWEEGSHPETGAETEDGAGEGKGFNLNVPLSFGLGDAAYRAAFTDRILPRLRAFAPQLLVIAAGQDGNQFDPNGRMCLTMAGYHWMASALAHVASQQCDFPVLAVQEGGYARTYTAYCTHAALCGLIGREIGLDDPLAFLPGV